MRESILTKNIKPLWVPGRYGVALPILLWMILAWAWCAYRSRDAVGPGSARVVRLPGRIFFEESLLVAFALVVLAKLLWAALGPADTRTLLSQAAPWGMLLAGYWLVRSMVRRSSSHEVMALLYFVAVATGLGALLFILHQGLHVPIYHVDEYLTFTFNGQVLTRTFWFMPPLLIFALAFSLVQRRWTVVNIGILVVTGAAVVVSYTRIYLLAAAAVVVAVLALRWAKERNLGRLLGWVSKLIVILAVVGVALMVALPTPTQYFLTRVGTLTHASTLTADSDVLVRGSALDQVTGTLADRGQVYVGASYGAEDSLSANIQSWTSDSTWTGLMYWTGIFGIALFLGMFLLFGIRAFRLFWNTQGEAEILAAVLFAVVVATFVQMFASWTFLDPRFYAMGLWPFAFITGQAARRTAASTTPYEVTSERPSTAAATQTTSK
jgi:hypothetical protein